MTTCHARLLEIVAFYFFFVNRVRNTKQLCEPEVGGSISAQRIALFSSTIRSVAWVRNWLYYALRK